MEKDIRPHGVLLFLFSLYAILIIISLVFPAGGIPLLPGLRLHFPSVSGLLDPEHPDYADISHLDRLTDVPGPSDAIRPNLTGASPDTLYAAAEGSSHQPPGEAPDQEPGFPLEHPEGNEGSLHRFFLSLHGIGERPGRVRIIHYGDSQIENDRISSVLRNRFQAEFGGAGTGMFPVVSAIPHSPSLRVRTDGEWVRHSPIGGTAGGTHNRYGLLLSYSWLPVNPGETVSSFSFRTSASNNNLSPGEKELGIVFGYNKEPFSFEVRRGVDVIASGQSGPSDSLVLFSCRLTGPPGEYSLVFSGTGLPEIYSVFLDDVSGVVVDNVPLRGSSGLEFARTDAETMKSMIDLLNVGLVILQFGVNVVPWMTGDYTYYENALLRQIRFFQSLQPDLAIIVVGVSDMSRKNAAGHLESWPNIERIRDAQRNAAFRAGVPFWDLYRAMGGNNSMPSWVEADPPLGQRDYTHFTYRGSALVGELLFNAIMEDYNRFMNDIKNRTADLQSGV